MKFILFALLYQAVFAKDMVTLTPNQLTINDKDFTSGSPVQIVLNAAPLGDVVVAFNSPALLRVDKCQLSFTRDNWKTPQTVTVYPISNTNANGVKQIDLPIKIYSAGGATTGNSTCTVRDQKLPISRTIVAAKMCSAWGDPHFTSFDGKTFDVLEPWEGQYTFFESATKETIVQVHHFPCNTGVVCMDRISIKHHDAYLGLSIPTSKSTGNIDAVTVDFIKGNKDRIKFDRRMAKFFMGADPAPTFDVTLADGTYMMIQFAFWGGIDVWYGNIQMTAPGIYQNRVSGLCGTFNDNPDDDIVDLNSLKVVANSPTDLFTCKDKCPGFTTTAKDDMNECIIPDQFNPPICAPPAVTTTAAATSTTTAAMAPTLVAAAHVDIQVTVKVVVVTSTQLNIEKHKAGEDNVAYCMRVGAKFQGNATKEMVSNFCKTDAKFSKDPSGVVAGMVSMLQAHAQAEVRLAISPAGGDPHATTSPHFQDMMKKFQLRPEQKQITKHVNPNTGSAYASAAASAYARAPSNAPTGNGKACRKRKLCYC